MPFAYLVADAALLPPESIRFFYLDRAWTDALVQGALSVGTVTTADRAAARGAVPDRPRRGRRGGAACPAARRREPCRQGRAGTVTGFLLRSRLVSGWPGLHVRAYRSELGQDDDDIDPRVRPATRLKLLRLERLAPAVLLVAVRRRPAVVHVEEPRQGIQFGALRRRPATHFDAAASCRCATPRPAPTSSPATATYPCRSGATPPASSTWPSCAERMVAEAGDAAAAPTVDGAEFALQMLRFPFRQVFGDPADEPAADLADVFRPTRQLRRAAGEASRR